MEGGDNTLISFDPMSLVVGILIGAWITVWAAWVVCYRGD